MSEGLKALLEAAQFIEQQEKLKESPHAATAIPAILNEQQRFIVQTAYDATLAAAAAVASAPTTTTATTITNGHVNNNNNNNNNNSTNSINGINIRNSNIRHGSGSGNAGSSIHQVSSSAPAAAATFQHVNGHQNHNQHHHNNSTSLHLHHHTPTTVLTNGTTTTTIASATTTNGHQSHVTTTPPSQPLNFNHHQQQQQQQQQNSQLLNANHHDYEFNGIVNGVGVTIIAANTPSQQQTTSSSSSPSLNGRSGESSRIITANNHHHHHQLNVQNHNNNNNNSMMVDDIPPTSNLQQQHSPPRHVSSSVGGTHYMQMINTASAAGQQQTTVGAATGSNHVTHSTPRRRTISSTSNGAGTREVHNKLEKNRRAHLKECYEQLKNELSLKDEDRRKTSNLAILGEALKCVKNLNHLDKVMDDECELLAKEKINLQKRFVCLKRELGSKYEQIFSGIFLDNDIGSIPNERDNINETHSLASGRGSALYSSSSSLSSGGSSSSGGSGNNTMSSPVGAGLQTAMPTTISPVINKINNNVNTTTSPISISNNNVIIQQQQQPQLQRKNLINTTLQAVTIPATHQGTSGGVSISSPPAAGSPTALITFGNSLPLSLTAKNISATAVTRGSPTPSTPSPSPSSSSGVSSSSSLISSSPPINGVINNGRNVTVNIPNALKLHATGAGPNTGTATILATSAPAQGVNNTNNAIMLQALRGCHLV